MPPFLNRRVASTASPHPPARLNREPTASFFGVCHRRLAEGRKESFCSVFYGVVLSLFSTANCHLGREAHHFQKLVAELLEGWLFSTSPLSASQGDRLLAFPMVATRHGGQREMASLSSSPTSPLRGV